LRQYAESFRGVFSKPQFEHFVTVLMGFILTPERRTLTGLLSRVSQAASLSSLSRFFSEAPWLHEQLAQAWLTRFWHQLAPQVQAEHQRQRASRPHGRGRANKTQVTAFAIFDDTTVTKRVQGEGGKATKGVGKHYSTTARGTVEAHSLVVGMLTVLGRRCPLPPMLYRQRSVAEAEGVPFQSKIELVVNAIGSLSPVPDTVTHVLVDAWYSCRAVWKAALGRGFVITGGIRVNRWLRLADQDGNWHKVRLSAYIEELKPDDFVLVPWRGRWVAAHLIRTFVYKLGAAQVLVIKENPQAATARCFATSDLEADVVTVASYAAQRWDIETWIEDTKELLGLDHYQLISADSVVRFWHLVCCCYLYLDEVRAQLAARDQPQATIGDALRHQQHAQYHDLLRWLKDQFSQGHSVSYVQTLLAA
jgi:hypothetical protein